MARIMNTKFPSSLHYSSTASIRGPQPREGHQDLIQAVNNAPLNGLEPSPLCGISRLGMSTLLITRQILVPEPPSSAWGESSRLCLSDHHRKVTDNWSPHGLEGRKPKVGHQAEHNAGIQKPLSSLNILLCIVKALYSESSD